MPNKEESVAQAIERRKKEYYTTIIINGKDVVSSKKWIGSGFRPYDGSMDDWIVDVEIEYPSSIWIEAHKPGEKPTREWACAQIDAFAESMIESGGDEKTWRDEASKAKECLMDPMLSEERHIGWKTRNLIEDMELYAEMLKIKIKKGKTR